MSVDVKYRTRATATGGRDGNARSEDGRLEVRLATPKELGGPGGEGTNPEQLFESAHQICPYSNATRNNVDVNLVLVGASP